MKRSWLPALTGLIACVAAAPVSAAVVSWTDWVSSANATSASGVMDVAGTPVTVTFSATSPYAFFQDGIGDTNYWTENTPAPYTGTTVNGVPSGEDPVANAPTAGEMIALGGASTVTLTFSQAVQDLYFALVSWNLQPGGVIDFGHPVTLVSEGFGFWGDGVIALNGSGTGINPTGEYHGVIKIGGSYSSLTFVHNSEFWHGFTVGAAGLAEPPDGVPEPGMLGLLGLGLAALAAARRRPRG